MPGPMGGGMRGPGRRMQGGTRIENPGKVFKRLMAYIFKNYGIHFIFVLVWFSPNNGLFTVSVSSLVIC